VSLAAAAFVTIYATKSSQAASPAEVPASGAGAFEKAVQPALATCAMCHNPELASGGLNLAGFTRLDSVAAQRGAWEKVTHKIRTGEMPPRGVPRLPEADVEALLAVVEKEFDRLDRAAKPDPGRVTARRLNRTEYANTIRDLLGIRFDAKRDFPTDDSGYGFDNIGDVLTISPVLMEKYMDAAEMISRRAIGADPLPQKPLEVEYHAKDKMIRRPDASTIEASHRIEWDGEYVIRIGLPGERSADAPPVQLGFWMDGELLHEMEVETKPSGLVYFNPYSDAEMRLHLPAGDHRFRAGFIADSFVDSLPEKDIYSRDKNKFLESITFIGPFESDVEPPSRKKILTCDPNSGRACLESIISGLARRAYRRPVTKEEVASLVRFVDLGVAESLSVEQGIQLSIQAMLVSPHFLFRIEHNPEPTNPEAVHRVSGVELASRLSYFLWSSMPDEELLDLAESDRLRDPAVLDGQVQRMLADERSSALAASFAGQWLETRNLDSVSPDPEKFPAWGPELRDAMKEETRLFFEEVLRKNLPLSTFLDADFTFLNGLLAKHYGIEGVKGGEFRRVPLTTGQRGGVLGQASVLTVTSYPTRTSPVIRGKYVLENILGAPPPNPPPDVPALNEAAVGTTASLRKQMEQHRSNPVCASCHQRMDALGFGLENYDAIGRWRTTDGKFPVDSSGALPNGKSFTTPAEMRKILLADEPEFARTMTEKMLTYALGRGLESYDKRTVNGITRKLEASGYRFQGIIQEVVRSLPFQMRRGEAAPGDSAKPVEVAIR
jgi:mono/diheme cytochrome c family protein